MGAGVGTTGKGGVAAAESGWGAEAGYYGPRVELFLSSGSEFEEEEMSISRLVFKARWKQPFTGATRLATLDLKGITLLPVICRFFVQPNS